MNRRTIPAFLIIVAMALLLVAGAGAEEIKDAGGQWKYEPVDGGAVITGCEEEPSGGLVIPGELDGYPVIGIGDSAFADCGYITGVTIPESVTSIDAEAFARCMSLTHVSIPDSVTSIGEWAFKDCIDLTGVIIGKNVASIGGLAFFACESLASANIPASVTDIGELAFGDCKKLTLSVTRGSYAEQYAKENKIPYKAATGSVSLQSLPPAQPYSEKATLGSDRTVNIRSGPGTQYPQIGEAYPGISFYYTGTAENDFFQILYPSASNDLGYVTAYVMQSLASISPVDSRDVIFSMYIGDVKVKQNAEIYLDAALRFKSNGKISDYLNVPYAGVSPGGSYAVLLNRTNDKGQEVLWIGFVSPNDIGDPSENDESGQERPNVSGKWKYVLEGGGATITGYVSEFNEHGYPMEPSGDHAIPGKLDGYPVTSIGEAAFYESIFLSSMVIPDSVTSIGHAAFLRCRKLSGIILPDSVTSIGGSAFRECSNLTDIIIPDSVTSIGAYAFYGCSNLTDAIIPGSVTEIGENAFSGCRKLMLTVTEGGAAEQYAIANGVPYITADTAAGSAPEKMVNAAREWTYFVKDGGAIITGRMNESGVHLVIPEEVDGHPVTGIDNGAFAWNFDIVSISLPDSVTTIGSMAFESCYNLQLLNIPRNVTSIGRMAFNKCRSLASMIIPDGVTAIEAGTFQACSELRYVKLPSGLTTIGSQAFSGCPALTDVVIPASVIDIGENAFFPPHPKGLAFTVTEGSYAEQYAKENGIAYTIGTEGMEIPNDFIIASITVASGNWIYSLTDGQATLTGYTGTSKKIALPAELDGVPVTGIGDGAFEGNAKLTGVTIPANILTIGNAAFKGCTKLKSVKITEGITQIGGAAFEGCTVLASVIVPGSVERIGDGAFAECAGLTGAEIQSGVAEIGPGAFRNCAKLSKLTVPASVTAIGADAFWGCKRVKIRVVASSCAEQYAKDNGIAYVYIK